MKLTARVKLSLLGGFQAQLGAGSPLVCPHAEDPGSPRLPGAPPRAGPPARQARDPALGRHAGRPGPRQLASRPVAHPQEPPRRRPARPVLDGPTVALDPRSSRSTSPSSSAWSPTAGLLRSSRSVASIGGTCSPAWRSPSGPSRSGSPPSANACTSWPSRRLGRLLTHQQRGGAAETAIQTGLRLLALDPLQEPVHRTLMRLYARLGRREAALRQYQLSVDALKRELSTSPEAETNQLHQEILRSRSSRLDRATVAGPAGGTRARPRGRLSWPPPWRPLPERPAADEPAGADLGADRPGGCARGGDGAAGDAPARHPDRGRGHRQDAAGPGGRASGCCRVSPTGSGSPSSRPCPIPGWCRPPSRSPSGSRCLAGAESPERVAAALGAQARAAHAGQLRARDRGGGPHGRGAAARQSARPRDGDQPRAATRPGRVRVPGAPARGAGGGSRGARGSAGSGRGPAVRGARAGGRALLAGRAHRGDHRRGLPAPRRHPARDRAGGGPHRHARARRARRAIWTIASGCSPAATAPRCRGTRRCARRSTGATSCCSAIERTVLRRLAIFAGGFTLEAASAVATAPTSARRGRGQRHESGREVTRGRGGRRRGHAIPAARDDARLRAREAHRERRARAGGATPRRILP